jgi:hypothetical protein
MSGKGLLNALAHSRRTEPVFAAGVALSGKTEGPLIPLSRAVPRIEVASDIPPGFVPVEAYYNPETEQFVLFGPLDCDDERHNCDEMGCGSVGPHVTYTGPIPFGYAWTHRAGAVDDLYAALTVMVNKAGKQNWNDRYPDELEQAVAALAKADGEGAIR